MGEWVGGWMDRRKKDHRQNKEVGRIYFEITEWVRGVSVWVFQEIVGMA